MRFSRKLLTLIQLGLAVWMAIAPQLSFAYDHSLSDDTVREAYFLGQDVRRANEFLSQYTQELPVPNSGPQVAEIALNTPYAQLVAVSAQHTVGYSAQQAWADYQRTGDFIVVRVKVLFTPPYPDPGDHDFWRTVSVGLMQRKHIAAKSVRGEPIYSSDPIGGTVAIGANVFAQFSVAGVRSGPVEVEVIPLAGLPVHSVFDLNTLR
jgi:hypothetical protein